MKRSAKTVTFLIVVSAIFYLWPFAFRSPWHSVPNGAEYSETGELTFDSPGIVVDRTGGKILYGHLKDGGSITVAVVADTLRIDQSGPARLVSLSADPSNRNFTLGQYFGDLIFRVRTPVTGDNGIISGLGARYAFRPGQMQLLVATYDGQRARLYVDGRLADEMVLKAGAFGGWNPDYSLAFGNELTGTQPWLGNLRDVAVYGAALAPERVGSLTVAALADKSPDLIYSLTSSCLSHKIEHSTYTGSISLGTCQIPRLLRVKHSIELLSLKSRSLSDYLHGFIVFLPVGLILRMVFFSLSLRSVVIMIAAWAGFLECMQMFLPTRSSSLLDLLSALLAGVVGCLIAQRMGGNRDCLRPRI